jgi:hypothetical protein
MIFWPIGKHPIRFIQVFFTMALGIFAAQCNAIGLSDQGAQKNNSAPIPSAPISIPYFYTIPGKEALLVQAVSFL